jgi:hypothetical protein
MKQIQKCFQDHAKEIAEQINRDFIEKKEEFRLVALGVIKDYITPVPPHFELDGKELKCKGTIDLNQTISNFLSNEYLPPFFAGKNATWWEFQCQKISQMKPKYEDFFRFEIHNIVFEIVEKRIESILAAEFPEYEGLGLYYNLFAYVQNSVPVQVFDFWTAIDLLEIGDVSLKDLKS